MTAMIGGMGSAKPHQKIAPAGSNTSARIAPALRPLHNNHPATPSRIQTSRNAPNSGTVVGVPTFSNGPLPYAGKPMT